MVYLLLQDTLWSWTLTTIDPNEAAANYNEDYVYKMHRNVFIDLMAILRLHRHPLKFQ